MEDAKQYVPVLKWKRGEQSALLNLAADVRKAIFPLIEVVGLAARTGSGQTKTKAEHLNDAATQLEKCWGTSTPLLLDTHLLRGERVADQSALAYVVGKAHELNVAAVPVVSTATPEADVRALARPAASVGLGVRETIGATRRASFLMDLARTLRFAGVQSGQADFVLDAREVAASNYEAVAVAVGHALDALQTIGWRSLTVVAAAFPVNLAGVKPGLHALPRADWMLWTTLTEMGYRPNYGDYAIAHPDIPELDMGKVKVSASIRYTTPGSFVVARGRAVTDSRHGGYGQYATLSGDLMRHAAFAGPTFSWGDGFIAQCASGGTTGNLTTWRQVGTNHHLTTVVRQLANQSET